MAGSGNAVARAVHQHLEPLGAGWLTGSLYAIPDPQGWYPALVPGEGRVFGQLYVAQPGFGAADLAALDAYEDFEPGRPEGSLYIRRPCLVEAASGNRVDAQAYWFNQTVPVGALVVPLGDFAPFARERGLLAFGLE